MRKLAINLAGCTGAVLAVMVIVSYATGATQEAHEHFALPEAYALRLVEHGKGLRLVMGLDIAFLILYTAFFAALSVHLRQRGAPRLLVYVALASMLGCALLDIVEDHHILALLDEAEARVLPSVTEIVFQQTESAAKFSLSFLALVLFGLCIPRDTRLGMALALFLTVGTLISAVIGFAAPSQSMDAGRWFGFFVGVALAIGWLRTEPDPKASLP